VSLPQRVGVLGGGRMGAGIAHAFLMAGCEVAVVERDAEAEASARARVLENIDRALARGAEGTREQYERMLHTAVDTEAFADCGLVVEAVPEDRALKDDALRTVEASLSADAVLASNPSSISLDDLAVTLDRPERFLGLHFFNPVPASALVEIVMGTATDPALETVARDWVAAVGKTPVVVRDAPGFASSRLGVALALEAIRMVEAGVATAADIDTAMELVYRHAMGPLRTTDIVGLDVRLGIAEELHATLGDRFEPPALLRRLVAEGHLGRKSGRGFYEWSD
jgi:3-hydroxybutyryl-CoA dehydrogenase